MLNTASKSISFYVFCTIHFCRCCGVVDRIRSDRHHFAGSGSASRNCRFRFESGSRTVSNYTGSTSVFISIGSSGIRFRIWINIKMESRIRIRIGTKTMPIHKTALPSCQSWHIRFGSELCDI
jgi:hypothetical protein